MKKNYKKMSVLFIACMGILTGFAQTTDVTDLYLVNADFDFEFDYGIGSTVEKHNTSQDGNVIDVYGWEKNVGYTTSAAIFEFGTSTLTNGATIPAENSAGVQNGNCIAFGAGWGNKTSFYQEVVLPGGDYQLEYSVYNANSKGAILGKSLVGWLPDDDDSPVLSTINDSFLPGEWETDVIDFTVRAGGSPGKIQIGFQSSSSAGTADNTIMCIDYVKILAYTKSSVQSLFIDKNLKMTPFISGNSLMVKVNSTAQQNVSLSLYNLSGQKTGSRNLLLPAGNSQFNIKENLENGIYILKLECAGKTASMKVKK